MNDESVDLSALDPTRDSARFNATVRAIARAAMDARSARAIERADVFTDLASWSLPALLAAGLVLSVSIPALMSARTPWSTNAQRASATEVLGIPRELTELLSSRRPVSLTDLHAALASPSAQ
jgi:hypothetical protein